VSYRWTDSLAEPLASMARRRDWSRVEKPRRGPGWLLLANTQDGDVCWYRATEPESAPSPLDPLDDPELPALGEAVRGWLRLGYGVRLLAWRVNRRAVLRVTTSRGTHICKLYRKDRNVLQRWNAVAPTKDGLWRSPGIIDWEGESRLLSVEDCAGVSLNRRWLAGEGTPEDGDRLAQILSWLQLTAIPTGFPRHGVEDEIRVLEQRLEAYEQTLAEPPGRARELAGRVIRALREEPIVEPTFCHRDLHDKQILLEDGGGGSLIDLDLAAAGPPALDPGNILAHLRLRALKGARLPWCEIARRTADRVTEARGISDSLPRWTAATLMRLSLIYCRRRRSADLLERLLDSTEQALERTGEWEAVFGC